MSNIFFHSEDVDLTLDEELYCEWLAAIASKHNTTILNINYIFCSDEYLLDINRTYLDHDYYTDIITFPYKEGAEIESDIFISIDRTKDNALQNQVSEDIELRRVMAHGLLHLIGFNDKTPELKVEMTKAEDESLILFDKKKYKN